jgi:protocatechuate 3,4-dioxygenase beta subunit
MSKNLTRKGLALGAIVALGTSLFAGAPAFAGVDTTKVTLVPNAGTTYTSIAGASFELKSEIDPTLESANGDNKKATDLTYLILNASEARLNVKFKGGKASNTQTSVDVADASTAAGVSYDAADAATGSRDVADVTSKAKAIVITGGTLNSADTVDKSILTISTTTDATADFSVTVQPFFDANGDGQIGTYEFAGPVRTLTFVAVANAVVTTSIKSAVIGTNSIQGKVVIGGDVNMASLKNQVSIGFTAGGSTLYLKKNSASVDTMDASYDANEAGLLNAVTTLANRSTDANVDKIKAEVLVAQAYIGSGIKLGAASNVVTTVAGSNASVDGVDAAKVAGSANVTATASNASSVRTGYQGDIKVTGQINWSSDNVDLAASGVSVRATVTKATLATGSTFTAGGVTLSATQSTGYFDLTTDADGAVSFTAKGTGAKDDSVTVDLTVLKKDGTWTTTQKRLTLTWADATVATPVLTTGIKGNDSNNTLYVAKGGSYTLDYAVVDSFGQAWASTSSYRLNITANTPGGSQSLYAPVTAGKASQAIVDNTAAASATYTVSAQLEKLTGSTWGSVGSAVVQNVYVHATVAATVTATVPTAEVATIAKTLVNADLRADANSNNATLIGYSGTAATISGTVTSATGAAVPAAVVTIAGANLGFISKDGLVYKTASITVNADANGAYQVSVFSTTAGKAAVTVTSGAATVAKTITFSGVTLQASTNVLTIDAPALSQVGRSFTVTVKVVDKFGNPVSGITPVVSVTGVGSITTAAATSTAGTSTVQFVAGANDFGDAVITAKYTATDDVVVSATKTVTVGMTDAQIDIVGKRVTAVASFSKGKTVAFYVDGIKKWSKLSASDADVVLNYNLKKGTHTITVKISGGLTTTERFIVK